MRRVVVALLAIVRSGAFLGAAYLLALTWLCAGRATIDPDAKELGEHASEIASLVGQRYAGEIRHMEYAIVGAAVAIGGALGFLAEALTRLRDRMARRGPRSDARLAVASVLGTALLHGWALAYGMATAPQLYTPWFYDRGGWARAAEVIVTDVFGVRGIQALGVVSLVVYLAGPFDTWRFWPARLRRAFGPARLPRLGRFTRPRAPAVAKILGALALIGGGASIAVGIAPELAHAAEPSTAKSGADPKRPNIVILAADSLRADRVTPRTMPHVSAWMDAGGGADGGAGSAGAGAAASRIGETTSFDHAYVSLPRTFPSWVTLLTGRWPHHHGIRHMFPRWEERAKDFDALPARLARAGYATEVVSDYAGDIFGRIDLGFQRVDAPWFDFRQLVRERAVQRALPLMPFLHSRLGRRAFPIMRELNDAADPEMLGDDVTHALDRLAAGEKPFFLTVFFSTAHFPYAAPAPYYARFTDPHYRGRWKYHRPVGLGRDAPADAEDQGQVRALYDGAVLSIDEAYGRVLGALASRGLDRSTVVVLAADHGETLFDQGRPPGHGDHLFGDEGTHIPLVIRDPTRPLLAAANEAPRGAGDSGSDAGHLHHVAGLVRDVDLAPTLYELAGVAAPTDLDGRSLVPALEGGSLPPLPVFAETEVWFTEDALPPDQRVLYPGIEGLTEIDEHDEVVLSSDVEPLVLFARHRMVKEERYKLVYLPSRAGAKYRLYDTIADPNEEKDVSLALPAEVDRMKAELQAWLLQDSGMAVGPRGLFVPRTETTR